MPSSQEARNNLHNSWDPGESGWNSQMDANLLKIGMFIGLSVKDRDLSIPPASPADGDAYIPASVATGAWSGKESNIAVWRATDTAWEFYDLSAGKAKLLIFIDDENRLVLWNGTDFSLGVAFT